jgi:hypothetical protein
MAITMRMVARILFFATEVTQRPLLSLHYTHINAHQSHVAQSAMAVKIQPKCPHVVEILAWLISRVIVNVKLKCIMHNAMAVSVSVVCVVCALSLEFSELGGVYLALLCCMLLRVALHGILGSFLIYAAW